MQNREYLSLKRISDSLRIERDLLREQAIDINFEIGLIEELLLQIILKINMQKRGA